MSVSISNLDLDAAMYGTRRPRVLLVEDDHDTRELMALALAGEGFTLDTAASGPEGLARLRSRGYDLVVTDYDMPGLTGAEMLREAHRRGDLGLADALIVTAHPEPVGVDGLALVRKPVDLGRLVSTLRAMLARRQAEGAQGRAHVRAVVYISRSTPASANALRFVEELSAHGLAGVRVEVVDVANDREAAEKDQVVFTPTVVIKREDAPEVRVVGDPGRTDILDYLLDHVRR
jgi:CheY-like chemotaxis protein